MAYYFMTEAKKGTYKAINISNSKYFQDIERKFQKPGAYSLEEIDRFTTMFDNEIELRERLVQEGILPLEHFEKPLSIRLPKKGTYKKVPYDFLYQKDIEYIMEPERLIEVVLRRYRANDFVFIKKLASYFSEVYECSTTAPEVARLSEASIYQGSRHRGLDEVDKNGDTMVARMLKLLIIKNKEQPSGKIEYKSEVNYRNLHDLIAFINNYDKKNAVDVQQEKTPAPPIFKTQEQKEQPPVFKPATKEKIEVKTKKRTRSKKKYDIEGQTSFFDV